MTSKYGTMHRCVTRQVQKKERPASCAQTAGWATVLRWFLPTCLLQQPESHWEWYQRRMYALEARASNSDIGEATVRHTHDYL